MRSEFESRYPDKKAPSLAAIGGTLVEVTVRDPLMRPVLAKYLLKDKMAVIEIA